MAKILVVEDDADVRLVVRTILEGRGHIVPTAATSAEAHAVIAHGGLDLIVADAVLSDGNGESIAAAGGIPIILMSGDPQRIERLRQGAIPFLEKPFHANALIAVVDRVLGTAKP